MTASMDHWLHDREPPVDRLPWPMDHWLWLTPRLVSHIRGLPRLPLAVVDGDIVEGPLHLWVQVRHSGSGEPIFCSEYDHMAADVDWLADRFYARGLVPEGFRPTFWTVPRSSTRAPRALTDEFDYLVIAWNDEAVEGDDLNDTTLVLSVVFISLPESPLPYSPSSPPP